ncbi:preprotein translocase subunit SecB [Nitrincola tapanii]|uniref:Preprotein translocase subunit SecB n=1 Tax=Nitrincola tapanii TaxID=1708751 RepID=A0A5A9W6V9_9GAMM|nr:preprotein translocase subunit SecB [Nitrincola tapanii]KAA0875749.1 preprotein translocase subunit SecB [Nitrincola tapanii]
MTISHTLQKAIDSLRLQDVYLRDSFAHCHDEFDPKYLGEQEALNVQQMHVVRQTVIADLEGNGKLVRVFVRFGVRWVNPIAERSMDEQGSPSVVANIEAEFIAEYALEQEISQTCIDDFATQNASLHVWPYWREFLASQCERMRLPRIVLPAWQLPHHRREESSGC